MSGKAEDLAADYLNEKISLKNALKILGSEFPEFPEEICKRGHPSSVSLHFIAERFCKPFRATCKAVLQVGKSANYFSAPMKDAQKSI
ncbi:hypothetical protein QUF72_23615 [Desulfobacterales bacterium HSG2]|nr:hypothetical protein [Desulfobacterales bacterium HSG2]